MKTLSLSLLFAFTLGTAHASAQSETAAPAVSPLPATEPEPASGGSCPMCKMSSDGKCAVKTEIAFKEPASKQDDTEKAVLDLEQKWCDAEAQHDVAFLEKVEADGFVFTDSTGKVTTKQDEIAEAKQGGDAIKFKLSDMKAHVYGNAAVLTGQTTFDPADTGNSAPVAYRWTDVFARQANGEWQVVASQATAIGQEKSAEEKPSE